MSVSKNGETAAGSGGIIPVDPSKVKAGDVIAFVYYGKVTSVVDGRLVVCDNLDGNPPVFNVSGRDLIARSFSADYYATEKKVARTEMAQTLMESINVPFTVVFTKSGGDKRTLRGRMISHEAVMGRSLVEELGTESDKPKDQLRLVDHRTLEELIVNGVRYVLK